jgi:hypothetical protein
MEEDIIIWKQVSDFSSSLPQNVVDQKMAKFCTDLAIGVDEEEESFGFKPLSSVTQSNVFFYLRTWIQT